MSFNLSRICGGRVLGLAFALACAGAGCDTSDLERRAPRRASAEPAASVPGPEPIGSERASERVAAERAAPEPERTLNEAGFQRIDGPGLIAHIQNSKARATLVNVWASWCGSCKHELPMLQKVVADYEKQGAKLLLVSVDEPAEEDKAREVLADLGFSDRGFVAKQPLEPFKMALTPRWPGMLPATFLFDETGKLRYFWGGEVFEKELRPIVEGFLRGETIDGEANFALSTSPRPDREEAQ
jgi:thiol-disulfide isomerase/thioredoxin